MGITGTFPECTTAEMGGRHSPPSSASSCRLSLPLQLLHSTAFPFWLTEKVTSKEDVGTTMTTRCPYGTAIDQHQYNVLLNKERVKKDKAHPTISHEGP